MDQPQELSPEQLMEQFQHTLDDAVFDRIVSAYFGPALAVARQLLKAPSAAEDAVQEAFLRIVRGRNQYSPSRPFSNWFYTILRNVCLDFHRRDKRQRLAIQEFAEQRRQQEPSDEPPGADLELLERLPQAERQVLNLRILQGLAFADIAVAMGISEEAAKKRAQRGLQRLRKKLVDSEPAGATDADAVPPWGGEAYSQ